MGLLVGHKRSLNLNFSCICEVFEDIQYSPGKPINHWIGPRQCLKWQLIVFPSSWTSYDCINTTACSLDVTCDSLAGCLQFSVPCDMPHTHSECIRRPSGIWSVLLLFCHGARSENGRNTCIAIGTNNLSSKTSLVKADQSFELWGAHASWICHGHLYIQICYFFCDTLHWLLFTIFLDYVTRPKICLT